MRVCTLLLGAVVTTALASSPQTRAEAAPEAEAAAEAPPVEPAAELLSALQPLEAEAAARRPLPAPQRRALQHELGAARRQLLRAQRGALSWPLALTGVLANLRAAAELGRRGANEAGPAQRFSAEVEALQRRAEELLAAAGPPYPAYGLPPPPPPPSAPAVLLLRRGVLLASRDALPPPAFQALLSQMQLLAFGDEKVRLARDAAQAGVRLSCREIAQLMATTAFPDEQVEIAAALYPQAKDPQGLHALLSALPMHADRERLRRHLGR